MQDPNQPDDPDPEDGTDIIEGVVKWFDPAKGFGFVLSNSGGPDILLHVNVLRNFGQSSIADGSQVELLAQRTERGVQATRIVSISPPRDTKETELPDMLNVDADVLAATPLEPARVKWFDKAKGFGFANVYGNAADVFLHVEVLRKSGLSDLQPGEALAIKVIDGMRGSMAIEVQAWETVLHSDDPEDHN